VLVLLLVVVRDNGGGLKMLRPPPPLHMHAHARREVSFLRGLGALETLVLDGNRLTHQVRFPPLGRLQTLWVNRNAIGLLPTFIDRLAEAVPRLRFLSMLGNQACPNYLNGGTLKQYRDYRYPTPTPPHPRPPATTAALPPHCCRCSLRHHHRH
jgi:hypothetical protein